MSSLECRALGNFYTHLWFMWVITFRPSFTEFLPDSEGMQRSTTNTAYSNRLREPSYLVPSEGPSFVLLRVGSLLRIIPSS